MFLKVIFKKIEELGLLLQEYFFDIIGVKLK